MTDAELAAKVRAAAEETLSCAVSWEPEARPLGNVRAADLAACARAALALVEQWEWHRHEVDFHDATAPRWPRESDRDTHYDMKSVHQTAMDRILASLRKAVG